MEEEHAGKERRGSFLIFSSVSAQLTKQFQSILSSLASNPQLSGLINSLRANTLSTLEGKHWFPTVIAPSFMSALALSFYIAAALSFVAAIASVLRGRVYIYGLDAGEKGKLAVEEKERIAQHARLQQGRSSEEDNTVEHTLTKLGVDDSKTSSGSEEGS